MMKQFKSFLLLTSSILIMAIGVYFFKFSNNFTFGGVTGLAVLVAKAGVISASDFTFISNMVLLAIGFLVFGKG
ncbi:MAG: YitT family protein, partial [Lachnospiraceae bacterium]